MLGRGDLEGRLALFEDGRTTRAFATRAGAVLEARGDAGSGGRLVGAVARHPSASRSRAAATAEVSARVGGREVRRSLQLPPGPGAWVDYDLPLGAHAGEDVRVRLSAGPETGVVWTPPAVVPAEPSGRGLVLVSIDTLRADALAPVDGRAPLMPRLAARVRRQGQLVRHHYAAANWTLPAHASLLTGRYPTSHGANDNDAVLDLSAGTSLPAALGRAGFFTAGIVDGGYVAASYGLAAAFDRYQEAPPGRRRLAWHSEAYRAVLPRLRASDFFLFVHSYFVHDYYDPDTSAEPEPVLPGRLANLLRRHRSGLLSLAQQHEPGTPLDPRFKPLMQALYADRAARFDAWLDGFLDALAHDLPSPPLVVITGDHGECLGDDPAQDYWHHGATTREEEIRVPLVILRPDRRPRPDLRDLTSQVDVTPTLLRLLGVRYEPDAYQGLDLLDPQALAARLEVYTEDYAPGRNEWAAIGRRAKLVEKTMFDPVAGRIDLRRMDHGTPGSFHEGAAEAADGAALRAVERRRRDTLYAGVDGLYLEAANPTGHPRELTIELAASPERAREGGLARLELPFQAHFLDPEDRYVAAGPGEPARFELSLAPGDTDLVVLKGTPDLRLSLRSSEPGAVLQVGSERADGSVIVGRLRTPVAEHPPPLQPPVRGAALRVWENEPPGAPRYVPKRQPLSARTYDNLRALGYIN